MASDDKLASARELAMQYVSLSDEIEAAEARLAELKAEKMELQHRIIPDFFGQIHIDNLGLPEASVDVVIKPFYKANIAADWEPDRRKAAFDWLEANGAGSLVATTVSWSFQRGELHLAQQLVDLVRREFGGANSHPVTLAMGVPWGTLTAYVKERTEAGQALPLEVLGATVGQAAKIVKRRK